jgi:hypothetical protein
MINHLQLSEVVKNTNDKFTVVMTSHFNRNTKAKFEVVIKVDRRPGAGQSRRPITQIEKLEAIARTRVRCPCEDIVENLVET